MILRIMKLTSLLALTAVVCLAPLAHAGDLLLSEDFESATPPGVPSGWVAGGYTDPKGKVEVSAETVAKAGPDASAALRVKADFSSAASYWGFIVSTPAIKNDTASKDEKVSISFDAKSNVGKTLRVQLEAQDGSFKTLGKVMAAVALKPGVSKSTTLSLADLTKKEGDFTTAAANFTLQFLMGNETDVKQGDKVELILDNVKLETK